MRHTVLAWSGIHWIISERWSASTSIQLRSRKIESNRNISWCSLLKCVWILSVYAPVTRAPWFEESGPGCLFTFGVLRHKQLKTRGKIIITCTWKAPVWCNVKWPGLCFTFNTYTWFWIVYCVASIYKITKIHKFVWILHASAATGTGNQPLYNCDQSVRPIMCVLCVI